MPTDLTVLIPETRRAIDGPAATYPTAPTATLDDTQILGLIADAAGDILLLSGGSDVFGHTLEATSLDGTYSAPDGWQLSDPEVTVSERRIIVAQAALNYFLATAKSFKTGETIADEGQTWTWSTSAQFIRDQLAALIDMRDRAIATLQDAGSGLTAWVNYVQERDVVAYAYTEEAIAGGYGGQEYDPRGFA